MAWKCEHIQDQVLRPAADLNTYRLHLAALDWSLVDPIVIHSKEDIKSSNWRERGLEPFTHQVQNLITFCRRLPVALIADDVGLGKTISAGLILSELITRRRVNRTLVLCPSVLVPQWVAELDMKFGIVAVGVTGNKLKEQFERSTPVVVTTYESARDRLKNIEPGMFDMCILDEAHKLRNLHGVNAPPKMALNVRDALERRPFRYVLMLTATPIQNKIWDLYSLVDLLKVAEGVQNPLGKPEEFAKKFLEPGKNGRILKKTTEATFRNEVRSCLSRTRRGDVKLQFPNRKVGLMEVDLEPLEKELVRVVAMHIAHLPALSQISLAQAMMSSPKALVAQAKNMASTGSLPPSALAELQRCADNVKVPGKLKKLADVLHELRQRKPDDWRALIFTVRRETQDMIGEFLSNKGIACGFIRGAEGAANQRSIAAYSQSPPQVHVIISTDAGAEGVNLQAGNVVINYDLPWNPMVVEQRIGRAQRLGSQFHNVIVANLVGKDTVESRIVARLSEKLQGICQAVGDVEGILEAADMDDDASDSFETRIRKMVVAALQGQDVTKATQMMEANIEKAKKLFEEERTELDRTLGNPEDGVFKAALAAPEIKRKPPRMPFKDFVLEVYKAEGFTLCEAGPEQIELKKPGRAPERIAFEEKYIVDNRDAVFAGQTPKLCAPGKPTFERIVQHWVDHHSHHVTDAREGATSQAMILARQWCEKLGVTFTQASYQPQAAHFQGKVHLRVRAGNGVDSFEKLMEGRLPSPEGHQTVKPESRGKPLNTDVATAQVLPQVYRSIRKYVENDKDVQQFCNFYEARLTEAVREAGNDPHRLAKVRGDLEPIVHADIVALEGTQYDQGRVRVHYQIDGHDYSSEIEVIPPSGQIVAQPPMSLCASTLREWPVDCLQACQVTGKQVLKHLLVLSPSHQYVMPDQLVVCEMTGEQLLKDETALSASGKRVKKVLLNPCAVTGQLALPDELITSDVSGRRGLRQKMIQSDVSQRVGLDDEAVRCAATGRMLLRDEAIQSKSDGQWYAKDQMIQSAVSGTAALPSDLVKCELTGDLALPEELESCAVSGKRVRKDRLQRSMASGRYFLSEHAAYTHDGKAALPSEIGVCAWQGKPCLLSELASCSLTGTMVDKSCLNESGELKPLRDLLDGAVLGISCPKEDVMRLLNVTGWKISPSTPVFRMAAPSPDTYAVLIEEKSWFGLKHRFIGVVAKFGSEVKILGSAVSGKRVNGKWQR